MHHDGPIDLQNSGPFLLPVARCRDLSSTARALHRGWSRAAPTLTGEHTFNTSSQLSVPGTLTVQSGCTATLGGILTASGTISVINANTRLQFTATSDTTLTGPLSIDSGAAVSGNGTFTATGTVSVAASGAGGSALRFYSPAAIGGLGPVTVGATGAVSLSGTTSTNGAAISIASAVVTGGSFAVGGAAVPGVAFSSSLSLVASAEVTFDFPNSVTAPQVNIAGSSVLTATANMTVSQLLTFTSGSYIGPSTLTLPVLTQLVSAAQKQFSNLTIVVGGQGVWSQGPVSLLATQLTVQSGATLTCVPRQWDCGCCR